MQQYENDLATKIEIINSGVSTQIGTHHTTSANSNTEK